MDTKKLVLAIRHVIRTSKSDFAPTIGTLRDLVDPLGSNSNREGGIWSTAKSLNLLDSNGQLRIGGQQ